MKLTRLYALILAGVLLACPSAASEAKAISKADRVVVYKAKRKLYLYNGKKVLKTYDISLGRNPKGHKQRRGDGRTPEGRYVLDWRNSNSKYYLSLHISYPNEEDLERARKRGVSPGGDIMIHGVPKGVYRSMWSIYSFHRTKDWTNGCIAVSNNAIEEIWESVADGTPIEIHP